MSHLFKTAQVAVVIVAAIVLAACSSAAPGESSAPAPAWSPPSWLHGTWEIAGDAGTAMASRTNIKINLQLGGVSQSLDIAEIEKAGTAAIDYEIGVEDGLRYYYLVIEGVDGSVIGYTVYQLSDDELKGYMFTLTAGGEGVDYGPFYLTRR